MIFANAEKKQFMWPMRFQAPKNNTGWISLFAKIATTGKLLVSKDL